MRNDADLKTGNTPVVNSWLFVNSLSGKKEPGVHKVGDAITPFTMTSLRITQIGGP